MRIIAHVSYDLINISYTRFFVLVESDKEEISDEEIEELAKNKIKVLRKVDISEIRNISITRKDE